MSVSDQKQGIYLGSRGDDFKEFITKLLKFGKLKSRYVNMLTDDESMKVYSAAFTSELVDPENNYQVLEQIGDLSGNKIIVNYMYEKFPQLDCAEGVKVVARLRINYGAKQCFSEIARKLGFWEFISATNELRHRKMKSLLEDVFEAFIGATERILDKRKRVGVGYAIVYDILASILDDMDISLKYEDLYDAKTRLKELFDTYESSLGPLIYKEQKRDQITVSTVFRVNGGKYQEKPDCTVNRKRIIGGQYIKIGEGTAALKSDAQQNAALAAIAFLAKQGWSKPVPKIYQRFSCCAESDINDRSSDSSDNELIDYNNLKDLWGDDINLMQSTKEKSKYQSKYQSTPISLYTRKRNLNCISTCLDMGADPNISDSDGMYPIDLLFIGKTDVTTVKNILTIILNKQKKCKDNNSSIKIHSQVFDMYFHAYRKEDEYFNKILDRFSIVKPENPPILDIHHHHHQSEEDEEGD
jgi:dsRNA-specific ribonuclease